ncbi:glycosyltransferase family 2 protein [Lelliottia sp. V106_10]|uniref:glycosyltransferase family 2 protein n=1 Tax=Lelliottia wanjuensis TaxID=3050585 RepID=UPI0025514FD7|nr:MULTISPECIES: glycosyltransferase family 2 protein [unclassified Lelliottia]MDK9357989.1 glycosyltransferase family 2 protein [Lelliottia sp. V106_16]MDK9374979.1 glycosyltransferase family 2 protein [Lelliottia sp. V106_10]MDK9600634.1 glycosyltransferase family 2 protein [Lelliottia sp. V106_5]
MATNLMQTLLKRQQQKKNTEHPFVSVICPTWDRRAFLPYLLYLFQYQDYPADKRELVILDDSAESNEDLIAMMVDARVDNVRYIHSPERLDLGKKRNMLNELAKGEYIVCFDDDDYYPPNKISAQVGEMQRNNALFSGSDTIYIWYSHLDKIYRTHAFGAHHALNGTFAYHRNFLKNHRYEDTAVLAEEQAFLNNFTSPVLQIDPKQAILCISHSSNTYDKDFVLGSSQPTDLTLDDFVADRNLLSHYRRLSHAPLSTSVQWSALDKVAVIYDQPEQLENQRQALAALGLDDSQLVPFARGMQSELETHCEVLDTAMREGWRSVLLLDASVKYVRKEMSIKTVNQLLSRLEHIDWQGLLLGARYQHISPLKALPGVARITRADCACAYAVNGKYIPELLAHYREAISQQYSLDACWPAPMQAHCWLGLQPSFAFLPEISDRESGKSVDCTHWFFRKNFQ